MTLTTNPLFSGTTEKEVQRVEWARLAAKRGKELKHSWLTLARALTRNPDLNLEFTGGVPRTDGKTIWLRIPIELGDPTPHVRNGVCGRRDENDVQQCHACKVLEDVETTMYHEVFHISHKSFSEMSEQDQVNLLKDAFRLEGRGKADGTRIKKLEKTIRQANPRTFVHASNLISRWFGILLNVAEDGRVNRTGMDIRPGVRKMFKAQTYSIFTNGIMQSDGTIAKWSEQPVNMQALIMLYCKIFQLDYAGWFDERVVRDLNDREVDLLCHRFAVARSVDQVYQICIPMLERLRELGYCKSPDDPEDDPQPEAEKSEDKSDDKSDEKSEDEPGDDGSGEPEQGDGAGSGGDSAPDDDEAEDDQSGGSQDTSDEENGPENPDEDTDSNDSSGDTESDEAGDDEGDEEAGDEGSSGEESTDEPGDTGTDTDAGEEDEDGTGDGTGESDEPSDDAEGHEHFQGEGPEEYTDLEYGDPDECEDGFNTFGRHEPDGEVKTGDTERDRQEVERAIVQDDFFDEPSRNVWGVQIHTDGIEGGAWMGRHGRRATEDITIPESILIPALTKLRVVFSDNKKGSHERNLLAGTKIDQRWLGQRIPAEDYRVFSRKIKPGKKDWFICIGLDVSGSTADPGKLKLIKHSAFAMAEMCNRLGVAFAVYAHTGTSSDHSGSVDLDIYQVKSPEQRWDTDAKRRLAGLQPHHANLDGHTLEFYRKVTERQRATNKCVLYYTDGAMPASNFHEELGILQREIKVLRRTGVGIVGVGINSSSPTQHGLDTIRMDRIEDVPRVVAELERRLAQ